MLLHGTKWLAMALALALTLAAGMPAPATAADAFPSRPIRLLVGYAAGGSVDAIARAVAPRLARRLGQPVEVMNVAGASGSIAAVKVALADPDGHTLLLGSPAEVGINHLLSRQGRFDPLRDLTPIGLIGRQPLVLVTGAGAPVRSVDEFISYAARRQGGARYATSGHGTPLHLAGETLKQLAGVPMQHVPYVGAGPLLPDLKSGRTDFAVMVLSSALPHLRDGTLKAIGLTQAARSPVAPEIPALGEHARLQGLDVSVWFGLLGPAKLPPHVAQHLRSELRSVLEDPALRRELASGGLSLMDDVDFAEFLRSELQKFAGTVSRARLHH